MKTIGHIGLISLAVLLMTGCGRQGIGGVQTWQYKTEEIENSIHGFADRQKHASGSPEWESDREIELTDTGDFGFDVDAANRKAADDGWELVAAVPELETTESDHAQYTRTGKILLIYKKPAGQ